MQQLQWPLKVLSKAIRYKNLSGASQHIGLSQPQISRLIITLETELGLVLLDRSSKRKSQWTNTAKELAQVYSQFDRKLQHSIQALQKDKGPTHLHIGTLEGLAMLAGRFAKRILDHTSVVTVQLDVFDQNEIEAKFADGEIEVALSSRVPGKVKLHKSLELGYQRLEPINTNTDYKVYSQFEFGSEKTNKQKNLPDKTLISNSLQVRRNWLENYGGQGQLPSKIQNTKTRSKAPVLLFAANRLHDTLWRQALTLKSELSK